MDYFAHALAVQFGSLHNLVRGKMMIENEMRKMSHVETRRVVIVITTFK